MTVALNGVYKANDKMLLHSVRTLGIAIHHDVFFSANCFSLLSLSLSFFFVCKIFACSIIDNIILSISFVKSEP